MFLGLGPLNLKSLPEDVRLGAGAIARIHWVGTVYEYVEKAVNIIHCLAGWGCSGCACHGGKFQCLLG